ncbi:hypothetical protein DOY81_013151, partial [Sarcophaga bullata]
QVKRIIMSEGTETTHNVHIRKKRLLDSLNEFPELNNYGLHQQDTTEEPAFVLESFDENHQEIRLNSCDENDLSNEQQSNAITIEENKTPNLNEEHEKNPNKVIQLCQEYRRLNRKSEEVLRELVEEKERVTQFYMNEQNQFGNVEVQLTNLFKSEINTINDENEIKNANNFAAVDIEQETNANASDEPLQGEQAENAMQLPDDPLQSEINNLIEAYHIDIEGLICYWRCWITIKKVSIHLIIHHQVTTTRQHFQTKISRCNLAMTTTTSLV